MTHVLPARPPLLYLLVCIPLATFASLPAWANPSYRVESRSDEPPSKRFTSEQMQILEKVNRADSEHLGRLDRLVVPQHWGLDERAYSPLPARYEAAAKLRKFLIVHQPAQVFGAYENGDLVRWGPISSGRRETATPPGTYYLNWKSRARTSTENEDWHLKWYFNFHSLRGISFHMFALPGEPASHACIRLLERDAQWIYGWGEQWRTDEGQAVLSHGTPVIVYGQYEFGNTPPWRNEDGLEQKLALPDVLEVQDPIEIPETVEQATPAAPQTQSPEAATAPAGVPLGGAGG